MALASEDLEGECQRRLYELAALRAVHTLQTQGREPTPTQMGRVAADILAEYGFDHDAALRSFFYYDVPGWLAEAGMLQVTHRLKPIPARVPDAMRTVYMPLYNLTDAGARRLDSLRDAAGMI